MTERYLTKLVGFALREKPLTIVADAGDGTAGPELGRLFTQLNDFLAGLFFLLLYTLFLCDEYLLRYHSSEDILQCLAVLVHSACSYFIYHRDVAVREGETGILRKAR